MRIPKTVLTTLMAAVLALTGITPMPAWAGAVMKRLYLASNGRANTANGDGALQWGPWERETSDKFLFDPNQPSNPAGPLVYTTTALERPVQVNGQISVELYAANDAQSADFAAVIEDVQPDGTVVLVRSSSVDTMAKLSSPIPGKVQLYRVDLGVIEHPFLPGHRIRLEISSRAATPANQRVLHSIARPSALVLRLVE